MIEYYSPIKYILSEIPGSDLEQFGKNLDDFQGITNIDFNFKQEFFRNNRFEDLELLVLCLRELEFNSKKYNGAGKCMHSALIDILDSYADNSPKLPKEWHFSFTPRVFGAYYGLRYSQS